MGGGGGSPIIDKKLHALKYTKCINEDNINSCYNVVLYIVPEYK